MTKQTKVRATILLGLHLREHRPHCRVIGAPGVLPYPSDAETDPGDLRVYLTPTPEQQREHYEHAREMRHLRAESIRRGHQEGLL